MSTRLVLAALAVATLLPSVSVLMSTDAEAYGRRIPSWTTRWHSAIPTRSAGRAVINCGLGWHMGGDGKCYIN